MAPLSAGRLFAAARPGAHPAKRSAWAPSLSAGRDAERAAAAQGEQPLQTHLEMLRTEAIQKWPQVLQDDSFKSKVC